MSFNKIKIRKATEADLGGIIAVELERYQELHNELRTQKSNLEDRFLQRIKNLDGWCLVAEDEGRIVGTISGMPTNSEPAEFESWEKSTDYGFCSSYNKTLVYKNLYIVNLDVLKTHTKMNVQYLLMAKIASRGVKFGFRKIYFESRMPQFRHWVKQQLTLEKWDKFSTLKKQKTAEDYIMEKRSDGLPLDSLIRFYVKNGFTPGRVVSGAFNDPESLYFGVVFSVNNPLRVKSKLLRNIGSYVFGVLAKYPKIMAKIV